MTDTAPALDRPAVPKAFSFSAADTFGNCPRKWWSKRFLKLPDPPGPDAVIGTMAHQVLEHLSRFDPAERTIALAYEIARALWERRPKRYRRAAWANVVRALRNVEVVAGETALVETQLDTVLAGVKFTGRIDRADLIAGRTDGALEVVDYKSGKRNGRYLDDKRRQVALYAAGLEQTLKVPVPHASILWTRTAEVDRFEMTTDVVAEAVGWFAATWKALLASIDANDFPANPGALCSWCPACVDHCPPGYAAVLDRARQGKSIGEHGQRVVDADFSDRLRRSVEESRR